MGTDPSRLILGNGASELIDMITRISPAGSFKTAGYTVGKEDVQYREYLRASVADGRTQVSADQKDAAAITAIINPSNPTGDWMRLGDLKKFIESSCRDKSTVMVDESMLMWYGENWKEESLLSEAKWAEELEARRGIRVFLIHSWTKIWSCPGLRIGSVVAPSANAYADLKHVQVPWSVNSAALRFIELVVKDDAYLAKTWANTRTWRAHMVDSVATAFPSWTCHGQDWLSWVWIDTGSEAVAAAAVEAGRAAGFPIRWGKPGYNCPAHIRFGIREPKFQSALIAALVAALGNGEEGQVKKRQKK